ncbi:hypothetical protein OH77DRAFT_1514863 [Trametes cingulata]|nr:hypothetical protein OH77DRAFT_1514863 [Trametes cingulata]
MPSSSSSSVSFSPASVLLPAPTASAPSPLVVVGKTRVVHLEQFGQDLLHDQVDDLSDAADTTILWGEVDTIALMCQIYPKAERLRLRAFVGTGAEGLDGSSSQLRSIQQQLGVNADGEEEGAVLNKKLDAAK